MLPIFGRQSKSILSINIENDILHSNSKYESASLTPSPIDVYMKTLSSVDNESIDMFDVSLAFGNTNECNQSHEKLLSMNSETEQIFDNLLIFQEVCSSQFVENVTFPATDPDRILSVDHGNVKVESPSIIADSLPDEPDPSNTCSSLEDSSAVIEARNSKKISKSIISENKEIVIVSSGGDFCDIEYILSRNIYNNSKFTETNKNNNSYGNITSDTISTSNSRIVQAELERESRNSKVASVKPILNISRNYFDENKRCPEIEFCIAKSEEQKSFDNVNLKKMIKTQGTQTPKQTEDLNIRSWNDISVAENETQDSESSQTNVFVSKREFFEMDGKYLKSLVNSIKCPKVNKLDKSKIKVKLKNSTPIDCAIPDDEQNIHRMSKGGIPLERDIGNKEDLDHQILNNDVVEAGESFEYQQRQLNRLQGSLDSIEIRNPIVDEFFEFVAEKSKSLELIGQNFSPSKFPKTHYQTQKDRSGCTLQMKGRSEFGDETDNICTDCLPINDSLSTEIFYTIHSNCSSSLEDFTECDICSSCNLPDSADILECRVQPLQESKSVCQVCEICGEPAANFEKEIDKVPLKEEKSKITHRRVNSRRFLQLSLPTTSFELNKNMVSSNKANLKEDVGSLRRCVLDKNERRMPGSKGKSRISKDTDSQKSGLPVSKDEVVIRMDSTNRLERKGSYIKYNSNDERESRRYSSVDDLPYKFIPEGRRKFREPKDLQSVEQIRSFKYFSRKSLRRSLDNIGRIKLMSDNLGHSEKNVNNDVNDLKDKARKSTGEESNTLIRRDSRYSKTCMPSVRQIVDCLVAAQPIPTRSSSCFITKHNNHVTENRTTSNASSLKSTANENVHIFNNLKILHDDDDDDDDNDDNQDGNKIKSKNKHRKKTRGVKCLEVSLKLQI